jgi:hypothetical protein
MTATIWIRRDLNQERESMPSIFTKEHVAALDRAIAQKRANPGTEFITDITNNGPIVDVAPVVNITDAAAGAVTALVGADTKPADPSSLIGKIPNGGLSLEQLIKARDHALANL